MCRKKLKISTYKGIKMITKVFKIGNFKAIQILKGVLEGVDMVKLTIKNNKIIITPKKNSLDKLFELIEQNKKITKDFLDDRNQSLPQDRGVKIS
jgi:virulence-associated protein VagC